MWERAAGLRHKGFQGARVHIQSARIAAFHLAKAVSARREFTYRAHGPNGRRDARTLWMPISKRRTAYSNDVINAMLALAGAARVAIAVDNARAKT
jgi:hypothetical protein